MKKILSIILTLLMVISVLCVTAGAEDTFYEIVYGETVDVTVPSSFETEDYTFVKFVPESDGRFICKVFADDPFYAGCELYDEELQLLDTESSYGDDWDYVAATASFIAGNTYYFGLFNYAEEDLTFTLSLECAHVFSDGVCETCSFTCDHTQVTGMGICLCGEKFHKKVFTFLTIVVAMIFFVIIILLLEDKPEIMEKIIYTLGGVIAGAFGGYGFGKKQNDD